MLHNTLHEQLYIYTLLFIIGFIQTTAPISEKN